ncbi:cytochrome c biogenesis CcdA family protein [Corynebacterium halotolerans]|uniref:cytochrome c biogenesis CcdA family protein n=1 Tax=Corynebacterium halotolerans TaxID=225326 RepID=UPI003CF8522A
MELGLVAAFLGGLLTLLSPCSAMLLPAFFSYAFASPAELLSRTGLFYLGLITTLVPLGVLAGTLGAFVNEHRFTLINISAVVLIILGLIMLASIPLPGLSLGRQAGGGSIAAVYALGTVYGLTGVCTGTLLGAVLTMAAVSGNALLGGVTLLAFAAGMAAPLLVLSLVWSRLSFVRSLIKPREVRIGRWPNTWTGIVGGAATVTIGILLLATNGTTDLAGLLGATDQARLEGWVLTSASEIPDLLVLGVVALLALGGWLLARRSRRKPVPSPTAHPPVEGLVKLN